MALMWCMLGLNAKSAPPPEVHLLRWDMTDRHKTSPSCWEQAKLSQGWQHSKEIQTVFLLLFISYFCFFFHVNVYMHVPTGAIVARSIDLHPPLLHLYAVKSEARIATCTFWGGGGVRTSAASTSGASCRFCPFILFYFLKLFCFFGVFFCLAAATSASAEGVNSAPNHSARWITPMPMDNHAVK